MDVDGDDIEIDVRQTGGYMNWIRERERDCVGVRVRVRA
jgi:hypothetical protein